MPQINKISLDLRKRITDAHKAGNGFTKYTAFQVSRTGVKSVIKKFKESPTVQNRPGRGRNRKILKFV